MFTKLLALLKKSSCWLLGAALLTSLTFIIADKTGFWKPQGRIIYAKFVNSTMGLYIMDADGTHMDRITGDGIRVASPVWSPDGKEIAFGCSAADRIDLCVGKILEKWYTYDAITPDRSFFRFDYLHLHEDEDEFCQYPIEAVSWAPDQQRIAFVCAGPLEENLGHTDLICSASRDGNIDCFPVTQLYNELSAEDLEVFQIAWSPIEDILAVTFWVASIEGPNRIAIYLVDLHGQTVQFLSSGWGPAWARDGKRIFFYLEEKGKLPGIAVINKDGSDLRIVYRIPVEGTEGEDNQATYRGASIMPTAGSGIALSPDERYIATDASRGKIEDSAIYLIDTKTQKVVMLTVYGDGEVYAPDWSP